MRKITAIRILWGLILLLIFQSTFAAEDDSIFIINKSMRCKPASRYLFITETEDSVKYELKLLNTHPTNQEILLEIPISQIEKISLIQKVNDSILKQYFFVSKKLSQRIYYDRNIVFQFNIRPRQINTIVLNFHKDDIHNLIKPMILVWKKEAKLNRMQALELTRGVFYGILILFTFILLILTYLLNVRKYYYYVLYLISGIFYLFIKNSFGYELLWPDHPTVDYFFRKIMLSIYLITSILFLRGFIKNKVNLPVFYNRLRYFIYFGLFFVLISLVAGLFSTPAQKIFIFIQNIFVIVCITTVIVTFIIVYFNTNDKSIVLFIMIYSISFNFFLFYPQPEFGSDVKGVYIGQIYTYSNAFFIAAIICISSVYRVLKVLKSNEHLKREMSLINSHNNYYLIEGQQNERARVGRELHDGIGIMMSAVKMKMSAIKTNETDLEVRKITKEIDAICDKIRLFSHALLPPTLKKFGVQVALKDMLEEYKMQHTIPLHYNFNIPENLSPVSQHLIYDIIRYLIQYFSAHKPDQLTISIYVIPSINEAQIRVQHTGGNMNTQDENIKSIISVIDLLNGKFQINLLNAWNFRLQMEFPILLKE
ncbi:MAG: 7TM diverse intracellular signaling domain-containing protein [Chitinophagales bacterium]